MSPAKRSEPTRVTLDMAIEEKIRLRAFELFEARGREDGHEQEDWLQAEAEILGTQRKAAAA